MRYQIIKIRNGLWRLEWEDGVVSEHSMQEGAMNMVLQREHNLGKKVKDIPNH